LLKKIINTFSARLLTAIINLFIAIAISQYLGATGKGEQGIIITTIVLILIFSNLIGGPSIVYLVPRHPLSSLIIPSYIWSIFVSAVFFALMKSINIINSEYILHVTLLTAINSFASINQSILLGKERIKTNNYLSLLQAALIISTLIIYFYFLGKPDILSYIKALYFGFGVSFILSFYFIFPFLKNKNVVKQDNNFSNAIKGLVRYGAWNQIGTIAQMLSFRVSYYFIEYYNGAKDVGIYSNGVSLIESVWLISSSITLVQYSRIVNSEDVSYSQKLTINLTKISLLLAAIVLIPLILLPSSFYIFIFGSEFGKINEVIWTLAPGVIIFNITSITGHYFSGTGKYHLNAFAMLAGLIVTIACGLLLIPAYGIIGAGITASLSYTVTSLILALIFLNKAKCSIFDLLPKWRDINSYYKDLILFIRKDKQHYE
jgi:O-antigen/teichoic acid export membrane protein